MNDKKLTDLLLKHKITFIEFLDYLLEGKKEHIDLILNNPEPHIKLIAFNKKLHNTIK